MLSAVDSPFGWLGRRSFACTHLIYPDVNRLRKPFEEHRRLGRCPDRVSKVYSLATFHSLFGSSGGPGRLFHVDRTGAHCVCSVPKRFSGALRSRHSEVLERPRYLGAEAVIHGTHDSAEDVTQRSRQRYWYLFRGARLRATVAALRFLSPQRSKKEISALA